MPGPATCANCATSSSASCCFPRAKPITAEEVNLALPVARNGQPAPDAGTGTLAQRMESYEREVLLAELRRSHHHMTNAARALGLERSHLYKKCQQLGIDLRSERKPE